MYRVRHTQGQVVTAVGDRTFLHVGTPKSGTSYLQAILGKNKERLFRDGLLFPGRSWSDQVKATRDIVNANPHGHRPPDVEGAWERLVQQAHDYAGDTVISMEWLVATTPTQAERIVASLEPQPVEVVITVRDLGRQVPAAWQEFVQNWETWTWRSFLEDVTSDEPLATPAGRLFWEQQDLGRLLSTWRDVLPSDRIHVVTVPPPGAPPGELWSRFADVLGVGAYKYDLVNAGGNESLGLESSELMRRINLFTKQHNLSWPDYDARYKNGVAKNGLSRRKGQEGRVTVPEAYHPWLTARGEQQAKAVLAAGVNVHGDLADLTPALPVSGPQPEDVSAEQLLDAALHALLHATSAHSRDAARLRGRIRELEPVGLGTRLVRRPVVSLLARSSTGSKALDAYRRLRR